MTVVICKGCPVYVVVGCSRASAKPKVLVVLAVPELEEAPASDELPACEAGFCDPVMAGITDSSNQSWRRSRISVLEMLCPKSSTSSASDSRLLLFFFLRDQSGNRISHHHNHQAEEDHEVQQVHVVGEEIHHHCCQSPRPGSSGGVGRRCLTYLQHAESQNLTKSMLFVDLTPGEQTLSSRSHPSKLQRTPSLQLAIPHHRKLQSCKTAEDNVLTHVLSLLGLEDRSACQSERHCRLPLFSSLGTKGS